MPKPIDLLVPLLGWFDVHARDLPWRRTRDPYAIWISEVMLQQTQVKTVIPYWERWMARFPTARHLAEANLDEVLKLWEGLGYYTRARNLHRAAAALEAEHGGKFPQNHAQVLALPGIGRYTAGAICSIAYGQPAPILDGNVIRVLTRLFGIQGLVKEQRIRERLWSLAGEMVREAAVLSKISGSRCADLNQSLMELGALVCTPRQPRCPECPVRTSCAAFHNGWAEKLPNTGNRAVTTARRFLAFVISQRGRYLVRRRPPGVLNGGLWEFPNIEIDSASGDTETSARRCLGFKPANLEPLGTIRHTITRFRITVEVVRGTASGQTMRSPGETRWCNQTQLEHLAFPSAHRRILALLKKPVPLTTSGRNKKPARL